mgnify:CR=1 FL=1
MKQNQFGRSMIEMLGVLAIVGVLSVGGIAGYSKAMEQYKINKIIEQYNYFIFGMLDYIEDAHKNTTTCLLNVAEAAGLIPETWKYWNSCGMRDELGNSLQAFTHNRGEVTIGFEPSNYNKKSTTHKLCTEIFSNIIIPLNEAITMVSIANGKSTYADYYGKSKCIANLSGRRKCLIDVTLTDIKGACDFCADSERCGMYLNFN